VSNNSDVRGEEWRTPEPTDLIFPKGQRELFKTITKVLDFVGIVSSFPC
jgi:hypothetical protein